MFLHLLHVCVKTLVHAQCPRSGIWLILETYTYICTGHAAGLHLLLLSPALEPRQIFLQIAPSHLSTSCSLRWAILA